MNDENFYADSGDEEFDAWMSGIAKNLPETEPDLLDLNVITDILAEDDPAAAPVVMGTPAPVPDQDNGAGLATVTPIDRARSFRARIADSPQLPKLGYVAAVATIAATAGYVTLVPRGGGDAVETATPTSTTVPNQPNGSASLEATVSEVRQDDSGEWTALVVITGEAPDDCSQIEVSYEHTSDGPTGTTPAPDCTLPATIAIGAGDLEPGSYNLTVTAGSATAEATFAFFAPADPAEETELHRHSDPIVGTVDERSFSVTVATGACTTASWVVTGPNGSPVLDESSDTACSSEHSIEVTGLDPDTEYTVTLTTEDEASNEVNSTFPVRSRANRDSSEVALAEPTPTTRITSTTSATVPPSTTIIQTTTSQPTTEPPAETTTTTEATTTSTTVVAEQVSNIRWVSAPNTATCWVRPYITYSVAWDGPQDANVVWFTGGVGFQGSHGPGQNSSPMSFDFTAGQLGTRSMYVEVDGVRGPTHNVTVVANDNDCTEVE